MGDLIAIAALLGFVLVIVAWVKRQERWASTVFWIGMVLVALPGLLEFLEGFRDGFTGAAP